MKAFYHRNQQLFETCLIVGGVILVLNLLTVGALATCHRS